MAQSAAAEQQQSAELAGALALGWLLPQESAPRWVAPLLSSQVAGGVADARVDQLPAAALSAVAERALQDRGDSRRRPLAKPVWQPGLWARTPPLFAEQPTEPQAPNWQPWCPGTELLEPPSPPAYGSARWRADMAEVLEVSHRLTAEQRQAAERWNLDVGSVTPPGVWNMLVREHLSQHPQPPARHYRILALLNMAMHDALVAGWRVKLTHWTERPVTAIRRELDRDFEPLVPTPPFPGYVSGHSVASGAAAAVLSRLLPEAAPRWQALALEASESRLWGGIHPRFDNEEGLVLGRRVAEVCLDRFEPPGAPFGSVPLLKESADTRPYSAALPRMRVWREPAPE
ncbi:vanadium-dependent haloperoxidase [Paucibacter sp. O1-1]|nr:vanadium-dependent haloperoxidase [Paucibacter sp. O1-1]MDA3825595.1 vanadium-dependent haloperoxidase [Paucibacter sp. O1-1]